MKIFEDMEKRGHEELIFSYFKDVDLKMIISLHDTTLGKTIGGLRMNHRYPSDMAAVTESLHLAQVMTYQSATADVDSGGANALLLGNPKTDKSEAYFRAVGRFVESLKGRLVISPDLGTDAQDFKYIQRETDHSIFGETIDDNTRPSAQITAYGVYWGIKACAKHVFGSSDLAGRSFLVQGVGNVGQKVVDYLKKENTNIYVSDLVYDNIKEVEDIYPDIQMVRPADILDQKVDVLVPCATGGLLTQDNIHRLQCKIIAGSAFNIFSNEEVIEEVYKKGITYAPVFLIAAGDLFLLDRNLKLCSIGKKLEGTRVIYDLLTDILKRSTDQGVSPHAMAKNDAMKRYHEIDQIKNILC